jgi:hypothetical protein
VVLTSLSDGERRVVVPDGGAGVGGPDSSVAGTRRPVLHQEAGKGTKKTKSDRRMNEEKSKIFEGEIDKRQHLVGIHGCSSLTWGKKQSVVDGGAATRTREEEGKALSLAFLAFIGGGTDLPMLQILSSGRKGPTCMDTILRCVLLTKLY